MSHPTLKPVAPDHPESGAAATASRASSLPQDTPSPDSLRWERALLANAHAAEHPAARQSIPCGHWPSVWSAHDAAAASRDYADLLISPWGLLWLAFDPAQAETSLWLWQGSSARRLSPPGLSIRSRVYEYGGGALCLIPGGVALVREDDQQIWLLPLDAAGPRSEPYPLSLREHCRYGDLHQAPALDAVLAVEESREDGQVVHRIVSIGLHDSQRRVLAEGRDFYSNPRVAPDGSRLCWIEWDRPNQPWLATRLCVAELQRASRAELAPTGDTPQQRQPVGASLLANAVVIAGQAGDESIQQASFRADGSLSWLSDKDGWWMPVDEVSASTFTVDNAALLSTLRLPAEAKASRASSLPQPPATSCDPPAGPPLWERALLANADAAGQQADTACLPHADHAPAPWQLGTCSALPLAHGGWLLARLSEGWGELIERSADGRERRLAPEFSRFRQLAADDEFFYCIAAAPARLPAVLAIARSSGKVQILDGGAQPLSESQLALPQSFQFATGQDECAQAFFYPPTNAGCAVPQGELPPLLLFIHGGPTSACYPVFDPRIQFWTQRGFAVADLNHRGSSGFGRACRLRLAGAWGEIEVEDAAALLRQLAAAGLIDPQRAFVRGSSAGGYSVLNCLVQLDEFRAGTSLYGISDPLQLRAATHKFEGDYLDWLIGDPQQHAARYHARAALHNVERIDAPVLFLQGALDAVVVPQQTLAMAEALRARGLPVECHLYAQERHGLRKAANLDDALQRECRFYQQYL